MSVISAFSRLKLTTLRPLTMGISTTPINAFWMTPCLFAEPLKKKKRLDPAVIKAREERRKKKLEKQIRRLEKAARQLKPIDECELSEGLATNKEKYIRPQAKISDIAQEQRVLLEKQWSKYKRYQHMNDVQLIDRIAFSQQKALDELRKESEELYQAAIQVDTVLLPYASQGPVETPPMDNYEAPDGDYLDVSKKW